jgi:oligopeptide/dipeptide ABC transporter ATP-binding protein
VNADLTARQPGSNDVALRVDDMRVTFSTPSGPVMAVKGVSWEVRSRETLVILGESGSGKSVSLHAVGSILPSNAKIEGQISLHGRDVAALSRSEMRKVRADDIGMVFQDPLGSLNPCFSVGSQIAEVFRVHRGLRRREAMQRATDLLDIVEIDDPERRAKQYPHQMSGGMRQRAMIALAIALDPVVLLADEPTTALDTSVRESVLKTMQSMRDRIGTAVVLVTHDIGVAAAIADRVAVMYAGRIVEIGDVHSVLTAPAHPYTRALLESMPRFDSRGTDLKAISGTPPNLGVERTGCWFVDRCPLAEERCRDERPELADVGTHGHRAACVHVGVGAMGDA